MRGVADYGTGVRIRNTYGVRGDVAAKTGTSQNGADGWFMLVHPNLVMGSWVGFTAPSIYFQARYYQQGAHTALPVVGQFYGSARSVAGDLLSTDARFDPPAGWVEPQPLDTSWTGEEDYYRYAAYLDSLGYDSDSLVRRSGDSLWRDMDEFEAEHNEFDTLDGFEDEFDDDVEELDEVEDGPDEERDYEREELEGVEGLQEADSLNRRERVQGGATPPRDDGARDR